MRARGADGAGEGGAKGPGQVPDELLPRAWRSDHSEGSPALAGDGRRKELGQRIPQSLNAADGVDPRGDGDEGPHVEPRLSHFAPFALAGVPSGGLFTGAEESKSGFEVLYFGGEVGPYDSCYHQVCDNLDNINMDLMLPMVDAASYVLLTLACMRICWACKIELPFELPSPA